MSVGPFRLDFLFASLPFSLAMNAPVARYRSLDDESRSRAEGENIRYLRTHPVSARVAEPRIRSDGGNGIVGRRIPETLMSEAMADSKLTTTEQVSSLWSLGGLTV